MQWLNLDLLAAGSRKDTTTGPLDAPQEIIMADSCSCPPEAGSVACELSTQRFQPLHSCPSCRARGKPVQGQTLKALLAVSLREVHETGYLFCRTQECPVAYFSTNGEQTFQKEHIRERVYQKEPESADVFVCYCFQHTVGDIRGAAPEAREAIVEDINTGIQAGQCACDLRNPQGSCCLGNVRELNKRLDQGTVKIEN
jgi:hypothetical protein